MTEVIRKRGRTLSAEIPTARRRKIFGKGEMADLTRALDWGRTPVGPVEQWPDTLLITVNTLLSSRHPMLLFWGEELVQFYNDAYRLSLREDKHPKALGQRGIECWPEIWPMIEPQIESVMKRGEASWHENQLTPIFRNGRLEDVYWTYSYSPVRDPAGEIRGTLVVCTETTDAVLARNQLQREKQQLAALFEQAPAFFCMLGGPEHVFEMLNPLYQRLVGNRAVMGKPAREALPESEAQGFIALLDEVYRTGKPYIGRSTPIRLTRGPSGSMDLRYLDFVYQPRREADGTISGIIALGVDVTENRKAERALLQSEKLAAVGRLASSIAHEINNPLEAVTNLLYLAEQTAENPKTIQYLNAADEELRRVSAIASKTLRFYRQATNPRLVTPEELFESTLSLYKGRLINSQVRLEARHRTGEAVLCFDGEIRQVLSNLIANAIDAMNAGGGKLLIRSRESTDWTTGRKGVRLTVADTGPGMSATTLSRIFEPFFTTKGIGGTGLGLWISRQIVERHRGVLRVRSCREWSLGSGTVFTVFLPYGQEPSSAAA